LKIEALYENHLTSLLLIKYHTIFLTLLVLFSATGYDSYAMAANNGNQHTITVQYANGTAPAYVIFLDNNQTYTISQRHSWSEDSLRYNLQSYTIDNGPMIPIARESSGNFTLDVSSDANHIVFFAEPQFQITIHGTDNVTFVPPSPTQDNWFDDSTDIQFIAPYVISSDKQDTRLQLDGWSLDNSDINVIPKQESGSFQSGTIHMSSMHTVDLEYKVQYYIKVISSFGRALGTGWYNSGTIVDASVIPGNDIIANHVFLGWQGSTIGNQNQMSAETLADSPKILVANWSVDYTNISMGIIGMIAVLVLLVIYQKRKMPPKM
jgi:hypothetical protein